MFCKVAEPVLLVTLLKTSLDFEKFHRQTIHSKVICETHKHFLILILTSILKAGILCFQIGNGASFLFIFPQKCFESIWLWHKHSPESVEKRYCRAVVVCLTLLKSDHKRKQNKARKKKRNGCSYLQGKVICYIHCGLTVVRVQVQQIVLFCTNVPEEERKCKDGHEMAQHNNHKIQFTRLTLEANEEQRMLWFSANDPDAALQHQEFLLKDKRNGWVFPFRHPALLKKQNKNKPPSP